jgi:hypothetical protein
VKTLRCDGCGMSYFTDAFVGFNCDYCSGKLRELTEEEIEHVWIYENLNVDYPTVSC